MAYLSGCDVTNMPVFLFSYPRAFELWVDTAEIFRDRSACFAADSLALFDTWPIDTRVILLPVIAGYDPRYAL